MSAFAALKNKKSLTHIFSDKNEVNQTKENTEVLSGTAWDDEDDGVICYEDNSDESNDEYGPGNSSDAGDSNEVEGDDSPVIRLTYPEDLIAPKEPIFHSNIQISKRNLVFTGNNKFIIGLKISENIVVSGQFKLSVLKGSVTFNDHHILNSSAQESQYEVIAPQSQGLPVLSCIKSNSSFKIDMPFNDDGFDAVIQLESFETGLLDIGRNYPVYKSLYDPIQSVSENLETLKGQSYSIIEENTGVQALRVDPTWSHTINKIVEQARTPRVSIVIGNKNTGKSTFSKTLLNTYLIARKKVSFLEIDPGQSEFSIPGVLSLTCISKPVLGLNIPSSDNGNDQALDVSHFYGYNSPALQPKQYMAIVCSLCRQYLEKHRDIGNSLIVNTPGWIKGFGKEVLSEITSLLNPDDVVLLSGHLDPNEPENYETLQQVSFRSLNICKSMDISSRYTAAQLRDLNKIIYFRQKNRLVFDFKNHLLSCPPMRLSYATRDSPQDFIGVNAVCNINQDIGQSLNYEDLPIVLDASLYGVYVVQRETWGKIALQLQREHASYPLFLNFTDFDHVVRYSGSNRAKFMGLSIIHSLNLTENYFNVYLPHANAKSIMSHIEDGMYKLLFVKGDGEIAAPEFFNPIILNEHEQQARVINQKHKSQHDVSHDLSIYKLPYVSFESKKQIGGVWRLRRGLKRNRS